MYLIGRMHSSNAHVFMLPEYALMIFSAAVASLWLLRKPCVIHNMFQIELHDKHLMCNDRVEQTYVFLVPSICNLDDYAGYGTTISTVLFGRLSDDLPV